MHGTIRAATLKIIIGFIIERFSVDDNAALKMFYETHIGKCFSDDSTGLYGQSAVHIFALFLDEFGME